MTTLKFSNFKPDRAGISAIFRSGAMQSACQSAADSVAAGANAAEAGNRAALPRKAQGFIKHNNVNAEAYIGRTKVLTNTAIGIVSPHNMWGAYDENRNHTLEGYL